jgi:RHS repeat-associated protein
VSLLYLTIDGAIHIPCYDSNGNVTRYLNANGSTMARYSYDAFGKLIARAGRRASFFRHRFSTKHFDAETGLCYYGRRFYSPLLKRWLNRDPLMEDSSSNLYQPMQNSLFDTMDPDGALAIVILAGSRGNGRAFDKATKEMSDALRKNYEYSKIINEFPESKYNCLLEQRRVVFNGSIFEGDLTSFKGKVNRELKSLIRHCPKYAGSIAFLGDASIVATESYDYAAYAAHGGEGWANKKDTIIWYDDGLQDQKDVQNAVSKKLRKLKCKKPFVSCYKTWNGKGKRPLAAREFMNIITPRLIVGVDKLEYTPFKLKYGRMGGK